MPTLTHRQECEPEVVAAVVATVETDASPAVGQRIDRVGDVPGQRGREDEAPDQPRKPSDPEAEKGQRERSHEMPSIQPHEFGIAAKVFDQIGACFVPLFVEDPALVGVVETPSGAMRILRRV